MSGHAAFKRVQRQNKIGASPNKKRFNVRGAVCGYQHCCDAVKNLKQEAFNAQNAPTLSHKLSVLNVLVFFFLICYVLTVVHLGSSVRAL